MLWEKYSQTQCQLKVEIHDVIPFFPLNGVPIGTSAGAGDCTPLATDTCSKSNVKDAPERS
jgi:hypothetical protein